MQKGSCHHINTADLLEYHSVRVRIVFRSGYEFSSTEIWSTTLCFVV